MEKITLYITGMACGGCSASIANALRAIDGVIEAEVSHTEGTAEIRYDPAKLDPAQLQATIINAGYQIA